VIPRCARADGMTVSFNYIEDPSFVFGMSDGNFFGKCIRGVVVRREIYIPGEEVRL
jgi:hypothetical protein